MIKTKKMWIAECCKCEKEYSSNSDFDWEAFGDKKELIQHLECDDWIKAGEYIFCPVCVEELCKGLPDTLSCKKVEKHIRGLIKSGKLKV